jgi:transposase
VGELVQAAGAERWYLPPYSPDLNPIENMWSKVKSILRTLCPAKL